MQTAKIGFASTQTIEQYPFPMACLNLSSQNIGQRFFRGNMCIKDIARKKIGYRYVMNG